MNNKGTKECREIETIILTFILFLSCALQISPSQELQHIHREKLSHVSLSSLSFPLAGGVLVSVSAGHNNIAIVQYSPCHHNPQHWGTMAAYKVLVATVLINCLVKGTLKSLGVLMLELDGLGVDTRTASWIPAIAYTLFSVLSTPVAKWVPAIA